jgi:hypothetical protein
LHTVSQAKKHYYLTPVHLSCYGNYRALVLRHKHTKGEGRTQRPPPVPQLEKAAGPRRVVQLAQWAHENTTRRGRQLKELEGPTRAHRPRKQRGGAWAARGRGPPAAALSASGVEI